MLLYEDDKIELDAPLKKYLPDFPNEVLSVRQLVTQTSGLKEYFNEVGQSYSTNYLVENEDVYATMMQLDTLFRAFRYGSFSFPTGFRLSFYFKQFFRFNSYTNIRGTVCEYSVTTCRT